MYENGIRLVYSQFDNRFVFILYYITKTQNSLTLPQSGLNTAMTSLIFP